MLVDLKWISADVRRHRGVAVSTLGFDNTVQPHNLAAKRIERFTKDCLRARPQRVGGERPHFWFEVDGQRYVYCYIYKNACTSFKNFICDTSPFRTGPIPQENKVGFLANHHSASFQKDLRSGDRFLFVFRDPVSRVASLFKNKFLMQDGNRDIFQNIREVSDLDPERLSFRDLLIKFIAVHINRRKKGIPLADYHIRPQRSALASVNYFAALDMDRLSEELVQFLPIDIVDRYFTRAANSTKTPTSPEECASVSAAELRQRFQRDGIMPSTSALVSEDTRRIIERLYSVDIEMIASIRAARERSLSEESVGS